MAETRGLNKDSTERVNLIFYGQVKADSHFEAETLKILLVLFKYSQAREERIIIYLASKRMVGMVLQIKATCLDYFISGSFSQGPINKGKSQISKYGQINE